MDIAKLFGLPAHPLLVHVPVVLLPLTALGAVAMAVSARMRARIGWIVVAMGAVSLVGVQLAIGSGEVLQESVPRSHALHVHTSIAETLRPLAFLLLLAVVAMMLVDRRRRHHPERVHTTGTRALAAGSAAAAVLLAAVTTVWVVRVGHNGAAATWQRVQVHPEEGAGPSR
jgi:hypothetical protein